jgi:hypothetical protein
MATQEMSMSGRFEYLRAMQSRYRVAPDRKAKTALLNEMESLTHLGRKHLIALMNGPTVQRRQRCRERQHTYDAEVGEAVKIIADTLDWICAERMQPTLPRMARHLIAHGEMQVSPAVLDKLDRMSVATLGRVLSRVRPNGERLPRAYPGRRAETSAQQAVPISVIPWDEPEPGHFEVDLVHHGFPDADGRLVCTIQFVDVLTGWSERFAIMGFAFDAIWDAIQAFRQRCPIPVREIHSDNGSEFINAALTACFGQELVDTLQTRGRPGHHNDNRFVEQKNSSLVRAYLGSLPLHTQPQRHALNQLYVDMWLYDNFFQPVLRQIERTAVTGPDGITRIRRKQDRARTPLERALEAKPPISREKRERLETLYDETNPLALKRRIHAQIRDIEAMVAESGKEEAITSV